MLKMKKYIYTSLLVLGFVVWTQIETNQKLVDKADYCIKRMSTSYETNAWDTSKDLFSFRGINWGEEYDETLEKLIERNYFKKASILSTVKPDSKTIFNKISDYKSLKYSYIQNTEIVLIGLPEEVDKASQIITKTIKEKT